MPHISLLQYMGDRLLAATHIDSCMEATNALLHSLQELKYKVSAKKAQMICLKLLTWASKSNGGSEVSLWSVKNPSYIPHCLTTGTTYKNFGDQEDFSDSGYLA